MPPNVALLVLDIDPKVGALSTLLAPKVEEDPTPGLPPNTGADPNEGLDPNAGADPNAGGEPKAGGAPNPAAGLVGVLSARPNPLLVIPEPPPENGPDELKPELVELAPNVEVVDPPKMFEEEEVVPPPKVEAPKGFLFGLAVEAEPPRPLKKPPPPPEELVPPNMLVPEDVAAPPPPNIDVVVEPPPNGELVLDPPPNGELVLDVPPPKIELLAEVT